MMKYFFIFLFLPLLLKADDTILAIGKAKQEKIHLLFKVEGNSSELNLLKNKLEDDFSFYPDLFKLDSSTAADVFTVVLRDTYASGEFKVKGEILGGKGNQKFFEFNLTAKPNQIVSSAHTIAHQIFMKLTGKTQSIFSSFLVFVHEEYTNRKEVVKEIYRMDFDGGNIQKITNHRSVVFSPALSPDNTKVVYGLMTTHQNYNKNVDLYMLNLASGETEVLSEAEGINSGAIFSADGSKIYFTKTLAGNAEIVEMDLASKSIRSVTQHLSDDVDSSINRSGDRMTFLSGRSGKAMIFTLDPRGTEKDVKRVSFVGQFNATPRFSPDGKEIVFSSWIDRGFDLYRMSINPVDGSGTNLVRLTKNAGSNENPSYSKDGQFIVFSSRRKEGTGRPTHRLYLMNREGEIIKNITPGHTQCVSPRMSN